MPPPLPSPSAFVAQLLSSLSADPTSSSADASSTAANDVNPLLSASEATRARLLTLHVLFPNELLPALDLLDRRLVTRCRVFRDGELGMEENTRGGHVSDVDKNGDVGDESVVDAGGGLQDPGPNASNDNEKHVQPRDSCKGMGSMGYTAECKNHARHKEIALASLYSPSHVPYASTAEARTTTIHEHLHRPNASAQTGASNKLHRPSEAPAHAGSTRSPQPTIHLYPCNNRHACPQHLHRTTPPQHAQPAEADCVYLVRSAAQHRASRYASGFNAAATAPWYYEVRLHAWHCSCPAFTFAAFPAGMHARPLSVQHVRGKELLRELRGHCANGVHHDCAEGMHLAYAQSESTPGGKFGGTLPCLSEEEEQRLPAVCKHILACALAQYAPLFQSKVEEKDISVEEAAGWAAGWGD